MAQFNRGNRFLLTPSQSFPGKQENPSSSLSRQVNNNLSVYFFLDSKISNGRMKVQFRRAVKGYFFCHQKNNKKAERLYMKFSSTFNTSVQRYLYPLFRNQHAHFLLLHLFRRMSQPSGQDMKMLNKHTSGVARNFLEGD